MHSSVFTPELQDQMDCYCDILQYEKQETHCTGKSTDQTRRKSRQTWTAVTTAQ